jgi:hypothetical protein
MTLRNKVNWDRVKGTALLATGLTAFIIGYTGNATNQYQEITNSACNSGLFKMGSSDKAINGCAYTPGASISRDTPYSVTSFNDLAGHTGLMVPGMLLATFGASLLQRVSKRNNNFEIPQERRLVNLLPEQ